MLNNRSHDLTAIGVQRSIDLPAPGIHPRGNVARGFRRSGGFRLQPEETLERIEPGDADQWLALRKRQPLHRRDPNAQAGERPRPGRHREYINLRQGDAAWFEQCHEIAGEASSLRCRGVSGNLAQRHTVARHGATRHSRRGVKSQHHHRWMIIARRQQAAGRDTLPFLPTMLTTHCPLPAAR